MATVLVIDDDRSFRDYLEILLRRAGYDVRSLGRAAEAVALVTGGGIDAVITDLYMPEVDGIETVRAIKRVAPDLPVICISGGYPDASDPCLNIVRVLGADAVLPKPMRPRDLLDRLVPTQH